MLDKPAGDSTGIEQLLNPAGKMTGVDAQRGGLGIIFR